MQSWEHYLNSLSQEQLKAVLDEFQKVYSSMAWGGVNKGHETIQRRFYCWRKGTRVTEIENWFSERMKQNVN